MSDEKEWWCTKCKLVTHKNGRYPPLCKKCRMLCIERENENK